ncbi:uncharacterized protein LOC113065634 [Carassius auratus]|uniref:Uncharacterized protein LOC113065634 n=1 Tax=Carassius auratus TaxID=7957 RepID=A0A6P6M823_CARAU|nr:uncharacterized protein LOC113065634 [Carassius auratus]
MIRMCVLCGLVIMLIPALGSCVQYEVVEVIEGGDAILNFKASGLTIFYKMHCENQTKITQIGQYCCLDDNCSTSSRTPEVSIETGRLILHNVNYNRCFSAKTIQGSKEIFYNVTIKELHFTISTEMSILKFPTETPNYSLTSDNFCNNTLSNATTTHIAVAVVILVLIGLFVIWYKCTQAEVLASERKCCRVMLAKVSHDEIIMGNPAAANSLLTTVNETQL